MTERTPLLVVGGTGFIGRRVVEKALEEGFRPVTLSSSPVSARASLNPGVEHLCCDIRDGKALKQVLRGRKFPRAVNCGGYVDHSPFNRGGSEVFAAHFDGLRNLVSALGENEIEGFVQVGSSDEYGANPAPQHESQREAPISCYSAAKAASTHFLQMLYRTVNFPAVTLRPFLAYGPGQGQNRFLPQVIVGCLEGRSFPVSEGGQLRDFTFIDDIAGAVLLALGCERARGEVINVGRGEPVSIRDVVAKVQEIIGSGEPRFGEIPYREGENMALFPDTAKAEELLGWRSRVSLEEGLERTIAWFRERV